MEILRDLSVYWAMFHVLFIFIMLFRSRFNKKKTLFVAGGGMGILLILNGAGMMIFGVDALAKVFLITCSIPSFVLFYIMSADRKFKFLLSFCLADTLCLWLMAVTNLLDFYLGGGRYILMFLSRLAVYPLVEYLLWRYLRKPYMELQDTVEKGWGIFAGMTMLYYILLVAVVQFPTNIVNRPEDTFVCVLILILMVFNYATIFASLYWQLLFYRRRQGERILQEQKNMLEVQLENQQRIRRMKHDMRGHMVTLSGLLSAGQTREALTYLKGVETEMDPSSGQLCANPYLNAVFVQYSGKLKELEAKFSMDIQVGEEEIPYIDLCQILSNGLENACDALKGLDIEKREMSVQMRYNGNNLLIRIKNRCREDLHVERGSLAPTSKGGHDHGFGLITIQEIAERLGGDMCCYTENGSFMLDVMVSC